MTYKDVLTEIETLRKKGYKVKVNHLRAFPNTDVNEQIVDILIQNGYDKEARNFKPLLSKRFKPMGILREHGVKPVETHGFTRVVIIDTDGNEYLGESNVSKKDHFNKKIGLAVAFHRAYNNYTAGNVSESHVVAGVH